MWRPGRGDLTGGGKHVGRAAAGALAAEGELCPPARQDEVNHLDKDLQSIFKGIRELLRQAKQAGTLAV